MPKVSFRTIGCRLNQAETDLMAEDLMRFGFDVVPESEEPDVVIVNTCTVTAEAGRGSRKTGSRMIADHPRAVLVLAGCFVNSDLDVARETVGDEGLVVTNQDKAKIGELLAAKMGIANPLGSTYLPRGIPGTDRTRVNLKVQTGCDEFCTFCIIPFTRGPLASYPLDDLLARARQKAEEGARELVLTGVHLGKYGWDVGKPDDALVALMEGLLGIDGLARIRLSSILSSHLTPRVVDLMREEPRFCRFLHVPLQSGDDWVLERMNRPYRMGDYLETIERVKEALPQVGLTTDVIVGFPGESNEQFARTLDVVRKVAYSKLHVFRFSPREGTPSASYPAQVPEPEKKSRSKELIALGNELRLRFHSSQVGLEREVLVEDVFEDGAAVGNTDNYVKVRFPGPSGLVGELARVHVSDASVESVRGTFVRGVPWEDADPRCV